MRPIARFLMSLGLLLAFFAATAAPAAAQADKATCFSTNNDNWKNEDFISRGLAACDRIIKSGSFGGKELAYYYRARGYWLDRQQNYDASLAAYNRAVELDPSFVESYDYRAAVWQAKGENDRAMADFNMAIRLDPTYAPVYYRRGRLYQIMGQVDRAKEDYNTSLALPARDRIGEWAHEQATERLKDLKNMDKK